MNGRSHIVLGLACGMTAAAAGYVPFTFASMGMAALGSLTPDIDTERSMLGCRLPWLSRLLSRWIGHRTATHSLAVPLLIGLAAVHFGGMSFLHSALGSFLIGYASHIAGDLVTGGCWALYPLSRNRISLWPYARVGSLREYMVLLVSLGLLGSITYHLLAHDVRQPGHHATVTSHSTKARRMAFIA
ncbi:metal-dependent hydrolase [Asaia bogorensis]|uniref:metal-dependent hydrolase n=1 Tax=Asaia bogorensis TaxID=91915 RepID=UPI000EFBBE37|nr:metal-dependent hydrolase [Asaia bogorensis]